MDTVQFWLKQNNNRQFTKTPTCVLASISSTSSLYKKKRFEQNCREIRKCTFGEGNTLSNFPKTLTDFEKLNNPLINKRYSTHHFLTLIYYLVKYWKRNISGTQIIITFYYIYLFICSIKLLNNNSFLLMTKHWFGKNFQTRFELDHWGLIQ